MASCGLGPSGLRFRNLDLGSVKPKASKFQVLRSTGASNSSIFRFDGLRLYHASKTAAIRSVASEIDSATASVEDDSGKTQSSTAVSKQIPSSFEIESLLTVICDTTSIAEFELKLGGFRLYVSRDLSAQSSSPTHSISSSVTAHSVVEAPVSTSSTNGLASSSSLALSKLAIPSGGVQTLLDKASDESLMILQSPKVGFFRRCRTIKGKKAPPSCKEKDTVKEGQVLCYIDQLGCEIPIESDISGEVVKILKQDGDPVGYGDALIAVLPSFPGIKLQ